MIDIGNKIRDARIEMNLTQEQLAQMIGVASGRVICNWEKSVANPDINNLLKLCEVFNISIDTLLGEHKDNPTVSELNIIKKYRVLDEHGKNAVNAILDIEYERIKAQGKKHKIRLLKIDYYSHAASAGTGNFLETEKPEELWVHDTPEAERADFVISISGNSMEPTYHDGDKVFVEKHNILEVGDIGIFIVNGDAYIKELGDKCLLSHNKSYKPISLGVDDSVYCCGKVLGVLNE